MEDIFKRFPTREAFDTYWKENYVPVSYEDVKAEYEKFVTSVEKHIFISDYEETGNISRDTFLENLSEDAYFLFQDTLTEVFYDKNPEVYELAFALYEEAQMSGQPEKDVADSFHQEYNRLYMEFMLNMFDTFFK
ncbi:MAG: serine/threonine protein phosphatase [Agathobacter sp.]